MTKNDNCAARKVSLRKFAAIKAICLIERFPFKLIKIFFQSLFIIHYKYQAFDALKCTPPIQHHPSMAAMTIFMRSFMIS